MARQRTPDSQRPPRPFAGADVETGVVPWLLRRRKMLAAVAAVPVSYAFLKLGVAGLLGVELSDELEAGISALVVAALVERVRNYRGRDLANRRLRREGR